MLHLTGNEIPCPFCRCPFDTFQKMLNHVRSKHSELAEQQWTLCPTCQCRFPDSKALQVHSYRCKSKKICQFCGDEFILIKTRDAHLKKHHLEQVKQIWNHHCSFCQEPFPTNNQLQQHLKTTHPDSSQRTPSIKCSSCDEEFSSFSYLEHSRAAHPEYVKDNWYTCQYCDIAYPNSEVLERHLKVCTNKTEEPKEINENITNSESGGKHSLPDLPLLVPITQSSPEKRVRCPIEDCNQYFVSFRAMYSHVRSGHPAYAKDNWSACPFCEKLFPQKDIIGNHFQRCKFMKFHTFSTSACPQLMICSQCKTGTVSFKHMYTVHKEFVEDNWMKCGACETYFPDMEYLSKHWNVCEASNIPQSDENQNTIPKEVTEPLKVPEENVEKSCSNLSNEKVEKCPVCNDTFDSFNANSNIRAKYNHMRLKHPEYVIQHWYQCGWCDQYYPNKSGLFQHKKFVHFKPKAPSAERGSSESSIPDLSNAEFSDETTENPETIGTTENDTIGPTFKMSPIVSYDEYNEPQNTSEYVKMNESMEVENTPMDEPENPLPMVLIPEMEMKIEDVELSEEDITDDVPMEEEDRYILSECLGDFNLDNLDGKLAWLKNA